MKYQAHLKQIAKIEFNLFPAILFGSLFPIGIGFLLRLPKFILELRQKNKKWTFDWAKFIAIAIPAVYIIIMSILPFSALGEGKVKIPEIIITGSPAITIIAGVAFGYTLLDCLKNNKPAL